MITIKTHGYYTIGNKEIAHTSTDWVISRDVNGSDIIFDQYGDTIHLTQIDLDLPSGDFYVKIRYHSNDITSAWSMPHLLEVRYPVQTPYIIEPLNEQVFNVTSTGTQGDCDPNIILQSSFDGAVGATEFLDEVPGNTWESINGALLSSSYTVEGTSMAVSQQSEYGKVTLGQPFAIDSTNATDFTIEAFVTIVGTVSGSNQHCFRPLMASGSFLATYILNGSTRVSIYNDKSQSGYGIFAFGAISPAIGSTVHIAMVKEGDVLKSYCNGTLSASVSGNGFNESMTSILFGDNGKMYYDEIRMSRGALYTGASYTVPVVPFAAPCTPVVSTQDTIVTIVSSDFSAMQIQTHKNTQWEVSTDETFGDLTQTILSELALTNLTSIDVTVREEDMYYTKVKYNLGEDDESEWSPVIGFSLDYVQPAPEPIPTPDSGNIHDGIQGYISYVWAQSPQGTAPDFSDTTHENYSIDFVPILENNINHLWLYNRGPAPSVVNQISPVTLDLDLNWDLKIGGRNGNWTGDDHRISYELLDSNGTVVGAFKSAYSTTFCSRLTHGTSLSTLLHSGEAGTYPNVNGYIFVTDDKLYFRTTPDYRGGYQNSFIQTLSGTPTQLRISNAYADSNYSTTGGAYTALRITDFNIGKMLVIESDYFASLETYGMYNTAYYNTNGTVLTANNGTSTLGNQVLRYDFGEEKYISKVSVEFRVTDDGIGDAVTFGVENFTGVNPMRERLVDSSQRPHINGQLLGSKVAIGQWMRVESLRLDNDYVKTIYSNADTGENIDIIIHAQDYLPSTYFTFNSNDYANYSGVMVTEYRNLDIVFHYDQTLVNAPEGYISYLWADSNSSVNWTARGTDPSRDAGTPNYIENFQPINDFNIGHMWAYNIAPPNSTVAQQAPVTFDIDPSWNLKIEGHNATWMDDSVYVDFEFLDTSNNVVGALRHYKTGTFKSRLLRGTSLATLAHAGETGTYPNVNGYLFIEGDKLYSRAWDWRTGIWYGYQYDFVLQMTGIPAKLRVSNATALSSYSAGRAYTHLRIQNYTNGRYVIDTSNYFKLTTGYPSLYSSDSTTLTATNGVASDSTVASQLYTITLPEPRLISTASVDFRITSDGVGDAPSIDIQNFLNLVPQRQQSVDTAQRLNVQGSYIGTKLIVGEWMNATTVRMDNRHLKTTISNVTTGEIVDIFITERSNADANKTSTILFNSNQSAVSVGIMTTEYKNLNIQFVSDDPFIGTPIV